MEHMIEEMFNVEESEPEPFQQPQPVQINMDSHKIPSYPQKEQASPSIFDSPKYKRAEQSPIELPSYSMPTDIWIEEKENFD